MLREQKGTPRETGQAASETSRQTRRHFTPESKERLIAGARKGGRHSAGSEKHYTPESKERQIAGARKGGEHSAGTVKHYTPESKERQIEGARKGGEHSHGSYRPALAGSASSESTGRSATRTAGRRGASLASESAPARRTR